MDTEKFVMIDERLIALLKDGEVRDAFILSVLLRKAQLNNSNKMIIPLPLFEEYFGMSPYEVRTTMKRLERWVSVSRNKINANVYNLDTKKLEEDLEQVEEDLSKFYFPHYLRKMPEEDVIEFKQKVTLTINFGVEKFFDVVKNTAKKFSLHTGKKFEIVNLLSKKVSNTGEKSAHLIHRLTDLFFIKLKKKERKKGDEISKNKINSEKRIENSQEPPTVSNDYLKTNKPSSTPKRRGRPPKNSRSSSGVSSVGMSDVIAAETETLGGITAGEFRQLLERYWSRQPNAFEELMSRLDNSTLSEDAREIIKTFIWWFPSDKNYLKPEQFLRLWFKPCLQFAENPVNFKYFVHLFSCQWQESQRPEPNQKHYAMLAPLGSWAFMRKAIINYNQRSKAGIYDAYSHSPYPVNFVEFRETAPKFLGNML